MSIGLGRLRRRLVLRIDIAAVDAELAFAVDADERAGASDIALVLGVLGTRGTRDFLGRKALNLCEATESCGGCLEVIRTFPVAPRDNPRSTARRGQTLSTAHVLLFSILAIVSGANSYRGIRTFIKVHRRELNKAFKISWKRPPAHTAIRYILQGLMVADVEIAFRKHAADLNVAAAGPGAELSRLMARR